MKDWVDKITREDQARGQKYLYDFGNQLGDWLALDGRTEQSMEGGTDAYYIGSNYYAMSVQKTAKAAEILGYHEDKKYYDGLYQKIREAIIREYFTETGRLAIDSQTGYIVALYSGIYREKEGRIYRGTDPLQGSRRKRIRGRRFLFPSSGRLSGMDALHQSWSNNNLGKMEFRSG